MVIFSIWAIIGVRGVRKALVAETERQSLALLHSLILASEYSITTGSLVDQLEGERLADRVRLLIRGETPASIDEVDLEALALTLEADAVTIWDYTTQAWRLTADRGALSEVSDPSPAEWEEDEEYVTLATHDSANGAQWTGIGFLTNVGPMAVWNSTSQGTESGSIGGIGQLIQEIGEQSNVNYIMLQAPDGIVFASRPLKPVLKLAADTFLVRVLESDSAATREHIFEGEPVLEAAAPFLSTELPSGMFRVGFSLTAVDDAVGRLTLQLGLTALLLVLLSTTLGAIVLTRRSLADLGQSYREVETLTGRVLDSIDQAVIAVDANGEITIWNPTAERWFARRHSEVSGSKPGEVLPADFGFDDVRASRTAIHEKEARVTTSRGERILVYSTTPLVTSESAGVGAVTVIRDETESRALAAEVRRGERLASMGTMAAGVAHEIRNPLNAIALAAQQLKLELGAAESGVFADTIWSESKRLNLIVEDFLSLARSSTQPKMAIDWNDLVGSVAQMARLEADKRGVALRLVLEDSPVINGIADELRKAVWNLLRNALAATPDGGEVSVTVASSDGMSSLTIDDTGSGIAPEALGRVFEPWFTTKSGGTGLGLAITHRIVLDHDGTIDITSPVPGRSDGTRVVVKLPIMS